MGCRQQQDERDRALHPCLFVPPRPQPLTPLRTPPTAQYAIEPSLRSHTAPLSRQVLLQLLGSLTSRLSSAPTVSSPVPDRPILSVRADLKDPDVVLLPSVLKNVYGLSIVEGRLWKNKKFNLEQIALDVGRRRLEEREAEAEADKAKAEAGAAVTGAEGATAGAGAVEAEQAEPPRPQEPTEPST